VTMPLRTVVFICCCVAAIFGASVWYSWSVGPHASLQTTLDALLLDDDFGSVDRNLSPWCWTGSCPTVTAQSKMTASARATESSVNEALRVRGYTLSRRGTWLVGRLAEHEVAARVSGDERGSVIEWEAVGK
jgi:hypothetical protein